MNEKLLGIINQLKNRSTLQSLTPKAIWNLELEAEITALKLTKKGRKEAIALMAGLHLWNDSLDASHSYAQQIEDDATGSYWHAIMHRMEQDYSNSKYWFRLAGNHPVKQSAQLVAAKLPDQRSWSCDDFVDLIKLQEVGQGTEG